jgi:transmembrane sensor
VPERPPFDGLDAELLDRYLAGDCTEGEAAVVRRWMMVHPDAARRLSEFLARLDDEAARPSAPTVSASWRAIESRIAADELVGASRPGPERHVDRHPPTATSRPRPRVWIGAGVAASMLLAAGIGYVVTRDRPPVVQATAPLTYATAIREQSDLRLADGTRVHLAPGSRLRVATDFGVERRDVYLDGEGLFDVVHDETRPFTVYAGPTSVRDIGTVFSVRSYSADSAVQVVVREGEVAMLGVGRLAAGDVGRVTVAGRAEVTRGVAVDSLLTWTAGRLVYTDAPLGDVLADLHRWYGADVELADSSTAGLLFTGTVADVPAADAVDQVAVTLGLDVRRAGGRTVLVPNARKTPQNP